MRRRFDGAATLAVTDHEIVARFPKRAPSPLLLAAGFDEEATPVPWPGRERLRFEFG